MSGKDVVIVGAARTAVGSFNGSFADQPAHKLGAAAIAAALTRAGVPAADVDEVIVRWDRALGDVVEHGSPR